MEKRMKIICIAIVLCISVMFIWSNEKQSSDLTDLINHLNKPVRIETTQGGNFQGILRAVEEDRIEIINKDGLILSIDIQSIESYIIFDQIISKETFFQDSASNRLIVMPTGFAMEPGEFHVANQEIAAFTMSYGLNEHFSFWSGISVPGFLLNARYIASPTPNFAVSFGSFIGLSWFDNFSYGGIIPYCIASWGEPNNNITLGAAPFILYDRTAESAMEFEGVIATIGGKKVITSTTSLIFENWIVWGKWPTYGPMAPVADFWDVHEDYISDYYWDFVPSYILPAVCFRIAGQRISWDVGFVIPLEIVNTKDVEVESEIEEEFGYFKNIGYKLQGLGGEFIIPIPIISITYRID